jgi:hypothetical protein
MTKTGLAGSIVHWFETRTLRRAGIDLRARFAALPLE